MRKKDSINNGNKKIKYYKLSKCMESQLKADIFTVCEIWQRCIEYLEKYIQEHSGLLKKENNQEINKSFIIIKKETKWSFVCILHDRICRMSKRIQWLIISNNKKFLLSSAAAAAKSLQSCLTLCDPIEGSPPGSPIPGILQARTLEWVAISFSNAW